MFELNKKEIQEELKQKNLPPEHRERLYQELAETRRARASNATSLIHQSSDIQSLAQERVDTAPANSVISVDALESPQTPEQWQQVISIQKLSIQMFESTLAETQDPVLKEILEKRIELLKVKMQSLETDVQNNAMETSAGRQSWLKLAKSLKRAKQEEQGDISQINARANALKEEAYAPQSTPEQKYAYALHLFNHRDGLKSEKGVIWHSVIDRDIKEKLLEARFDGYSAAALLLLKFLKGQFSDDYFIGTTQNIDFQLSELKKQGSDDNVFSHHVCREFLIRAILDAPNPDRDAVERLNERVQDHLEKAKTKPTIFACIRNKSGTLTGQKRVYFDYNTGEEYKLIKKIVNQNGHPHQARARELIKSIHRCYKQKGATDQLDVLATWFVISEDSCSEGGESEPLTPTQAPRPEFDNLEAMLADAREQGRQAEREATQRALAENVDGTVARLKADIQALTHEKDGAVKDLHSQLTCAKEEKERLNQSLHDEREKARSFENALAAKDAELRLELEDKQATQARLEAELSKKQSTLAQLQAELDAQSHLLSTVDRKTKEKFEARIRTLTHELEDLNENYENALASAQNTESLSEENTGLKAQLNAAQAQQMTLEEKLKAAQKTTETLRQAAAAEKLAQANQAFMAHDATVKLQAQLLQRQDSSECKTAALVDKDTQLAEKDAKLADQKTLLSEQAKKLSAFERKAQEMQGELQSKAQAVSTLEATRKKQAHDLAVMAPAYQSLHDEHQTQLAENKQLTASLLQRQNSSECKTAALVEKDTQLAEKDAKLADQKTLLSEQAKKISAFERKAQEMQGELQSKAQAVSTLEATRKKQAHDLAVMAPAFQSLHDEHKQLQARLLQRQNSSERKTAALMDKDTQLAEKDAKLADQKTLLSEQAKKLNAFEQKEREAREALEAKRKAEAEAKRKAEAEAKRKAEAEAKRKAAAEKEQCVYSLGAPGQLGFGIAACRVTLQGFQALPGTFNPASSEFGNYRHEKSSAIYVNIPAFACSVKNPLELRCLSTFNLWHKYRCVHDMQKELQATGEGWIVHPAFIHGGEVKHSFLTQKKIVDKWEHRSFLRSKPQTVRLSLKLLPCNNKSLAMEDDNWFLYYRYDEMFVKHRHTSIFQYDALTKIALAQQKAVGVRLINAENENRVKASHNGQASGVMGINDCIWEVASGINKFDDSFFVLKQKVNITELDCQTAFNDKANQLWVDFECGHGHINDEAIPLWDREHGHRISFMDDSELSKYFRGRFPNVAVRLSCMR